MQLHRFHGLNRSRKVRDCRCLIVDSIQKRYKLCLYYRGIFNYKFFDFIAPPSLPDVAAIVQSQKPLNARERMLVTGTITESQQT